jgi:hypothetical protein
VTDDPPEASRLVAGYVVICVVTQNDRNLERERHRPILPVTGQEMINSARTFVPGDEARISYISFS